MRTATTIVAGGLFAVALLVPAHFQARGATAAFPDVVVVPPGPATPPGVPIPYPNVNISNPGVAYIGFERAEIASGGVVFVDDVIIIE